MSPPGVDDELARSLVTTVPNVFRHMLSHARRRPAWVDMTYQQYNVLRIITDGEASQGEIARRLMVTAPVITRLASALVEDGLVERREDPADRRSVRLAITRKGKKQVEAMRKDLEGAARELLEPLAQEDRSAIAGALEQLQLLFPDRSSAAERAAAAEASAPGDPSAAR